MTSFSFPATLAESLAETCFAVEATSFERYALWREHHHSLTWDASLTGFSTQVGEMGGMPVVVNASFARIQGHLVLFYEATSQVVDHRLVDAWVAAAVPRKWDQASRRAQTDANNFHLCLHALHALNHPTL